MTDDRRQRDIAVVARMRAPTPSRGHEAIQLGVNLEQIHLLFDSQLHAPFGDGTISVDLHAVFERKARAARDAVLALGIEPKVAAFLLDLESFVRPGPIETKLAATMAERYGDALGAVAGRVDPTQRIQLDVGVLGARAAWCARVLVMAEQMPPELRRILRDSYLPEAERVGSFFARVVGAAASSGALAAAFGDELRGHVQRAAAALSRAPDLGALAEAEQQFEAILQRIGFGVAVHSSAPARPAGTPPPIPTVAGRAAATIRTGSERLLAGDLQAATAAFEAAIPIAQAGGELGLVGIAELGLARVRRQLGAVDDDRAVVHAERAYKAFWAAGDVDGSADALGMLVANALSTGDRGRVKLFVGQLRKIGATSADALEAYAEVLDQLEATTIDRAALDQALRRFRAGATQLGDASRKGLERQCARQLALRGGDAGASGADLLIKVIDEADAEGDRGEVVTSTLALAILLASDPARVAPYLQRALQRVEEMRASVSSPEMQRQISSWASMLASISQYRAAAAGDIAGGFATDEAARARGVLDQLALAERWASHPPPEPMLARWDTLRQRDLEAFRTLDDAANPMRGGGPGVEVWRSALRTRHRLYAELERAVAGAAPGGAPTVGVEQLAAALPPGTGFVSFGRARAYVITAAGAAMVDLPGAGDVDRHLDGFRRAITATAEGKPGAIDADDAALHRALVAPILPRLDGCNRLYLALDGAQWSLPFHALGGPDSLGAAFEIGYVFSATMLVRMLGRPRRAAATPFLGIADPDGSLPGAEREVRLAAARFDGAQMLGGGVATVDRVAAALRGARIVHLACHGTYLDEFPELSYLKLAPGADGDDRLEASVIARTPLAADLVVLGACHSARGTVYGGGEFVGFPSTFLAAGARSVLGSLWSIDDEAAAAFMEAFYDALPEVGAAAAARGAQLVLRAEPRWRHPYFWGAFQLHGIAEPPPPPPPPPPEVAAALTTRAADPSDLLFDDGLALMRQGDWQGGWSRFNAVCQLQPDYLGARFNRGACAYHFGDLDAALPDLEAVLAASPDHANAHYYRGRYRLDREDPGGAITDFSFYLAQREDPDTRLWRGMARSQLDQHVGVVDDLGHYLEHDPDHAEAWYKRGFALRALGRDNESIAHYTRVLELAPREIHTYVNRGYARGVRDVAGAIEDFKTLLSRRKAGIDSPDDLDQIKGVIAEYEGLIARGRPTAADAQATARQLASAGDWKGVVDTLARACALLPTDTGPWLARAQALERLGEWAFARSAYEHLLGLPGRRAQIHLARGRCAFELGDLAAAIADLDSVLAEYGSKDAFYIRGRAHFRLGNLEQAIRDLRAATHMGPERRDEIEVSISDAWFWLGRAQLEAADFAGAVDSFGKYRYEAPLGALDAHYWRGWAHRKLGNNLEAVADYTQSFAREPDPQVLINRAWARRALGERAEAIADLRGAIDLKPDLRGDLEDTIAEWNAS